MGLIELKPVVVKTDEAKWQAKAAAQKNEIGQLTRALEAEKATKADHVFRLRKILAGALDGHTGWQQQAMRELGRKAGG